MIKEWVRRQQGRRFWRPLLTFLLLAPAVAIIAYNTYRNWGTLRQYSWEPRYGLWGAALLVYALAFLSVSWGWNHLMGRVARFSRFRSNARIYSLSNLPRRVPGPFWYMLGRVHLYQAEGVPASDTLAGTALEIILLATTGIGTYFLAQPFSASRDVLRLGVALGLLIGALVALQPAVFNRVARYLLRRLGSEAHIEITYRGLLVPGLAYLAGWVLTGMSLYLVVLSLYPLPWTGIPEIIGAWAASGTVGLLASLFLLGIGAREVALSFLLAASMPTPMAVIVAILFWFLLTIGEVAWAGVFALLGRGSPFPGQSSPEQPVDAREEEPDRQRSGEAGPGAS
jgi:hypothetical protein